MIFTVTDFGVAGPYLGQMRAVLRRAAPAIDVVDLLADAPAFDPRAGAYLLAALARVAEPGDVVLGIVDPGVGGPRRPLALELDERWLVGPDNGLFEIVLRRAASAQVWQIAWRPAGLSTTFHGRDLFAPVAADLALGRRAKIVPGDVTRYAAWPDDLAEIVYVDVYGNAMTGLRATTFPAGARLAAGGALLAKAGTFSEAPVGDPFWYENSLGLVEIAANRRPAAELLKLAVGCPVRRAGDCPDP